MKKLSILIAAAAAVALPSAASAATIFSDSLQSTLSSPNWVSNASGQIGSTPAGGNALTFSTTRGGGDLFSKLFAGPGTYTISFDYLCGTEGGCGGFVGLYPGGSTTTDTLAGPGNDAWLWTDTPTAYPTPFSGTGNGTSFTPISFTFTVTSPGQWGLKIEDFNGTAGDATFRNLAVAAVPEPATWAMLILGFGLVGAMVRRRRDSGALVAA